MPRAKRKIESRAFIERMAVAKLENEFFKRKDAPKSKTVGNQNSQLNIVKKSKKCAYISKKKVWTRRLVYCPSDLQKITKESILRGKEAIRKVTAYMKYNKLYLPGQKIVNCDKRLEKALGVKQFHLLQTSFHVMNAVKMRHEFGKEHEEEQKKALIRMIMDFQVKQEVCERIKIKQELPQTSNNEQESLPSTSIKQEPAE